MLLKLIVLLLHHLTRILIIITYATVQNTACIKKILPILTYPIITKDV